MEEEKVKNNILSESFAKALGDAKVPMQVHLAVVKQLHTALSNHKKDRDEWKGIIQSHKISKGDKGDKGDSIQGEKGEDGYTPIKGKDYFDGINGKHGNDGKNGKNGNDGKNGENGKSGKNAEIDKDELIKDIIKIIQEDKLIDASNIRNLQGWVKDGVKYRFEELMHGGGSSSSSSGTPVDNEVVAGSGTTFTLANTPVLGSVKVYIRGQRGVLGTDYTISGKVITTTNTLIAGDVLADYRK